MIVFASDSHHQRFAAPLLSSEPGHVAGKWELARFHNGELHALIHTEVKNESCLVVGSVTPPDGQLFGLLMLVNAIKNAGSSSVRVFMPYMAYARQDKPKPNESHGVELIGVLLRSAGVESVVTIDLHSSLDRQLLGMPIISLSAAKIFAPLLQDLGCGDAVFVAPDGGALQRTQELAEAAGCRRPVAHLVKEHTDGVVHLELVGGLAERAIIVDDIIDSGATLLSACKILREKGVHGIVVAVTHGLFTGSAWNQLFSMGVKTFFVSDSCPQALQQKNPKIQVAPIAPLLPEVLAAIQGKDEAA